MAETTSPSVRPKPGRYRESGLEALAAGVDIEVHSKKVRGAAPKFIQGLEDMELHEGEKVGVSGRLYRRKKKRGEVKTLEAVEAAEKSMKSKNLQSFP